MPTLNWIGKEAVVKHHSAVPFRLLEQMMAAVFDVSVLGINQHLKRIFADIELEEAAVIKQYLTSAADGRNHQVKQFPVSSLK